MVILFVIMMLQPLNTVLDLIIMHSCIKVLQLIFLEKVGTCDFLYYIYEACVQLKNYYVM